LHSYLQQQDPLEHLLITIPPLFSRPKLAESFNFEYIFVCFFGVFFSWWQKKILKKKKKKKRKSTNPKNKNSTFLGYLTEKKKRTKF
jgi:hypothetical protein